MAILPPPSGGFGQQQQPMTQQPRPTGAGALSTAVQQGMGGMGGQPPMGQLQKPTYDPRAYLDARQKYQQGGSQGRRPLYTDFIKQQPMTQPPMQGGLGALQGGMGGQMQQAQQLMGGMGGQPQQGGGMDAYQQFLAQRQQPQQAPGQMQQAQQLMGGMPGMPGQQPQQGGFGQPQMVPQQGMGGQQVPGQLLPNAPQQLGGQPLGMPDQQQMDAYRQFQQSEALMGANMPRQQGMGQQLPTGQMQQYQQMLNQMPKAPTTQQIGQEDPRMQAMRNLNTMKFG